MCHNIDQCLSEMGRGVVWSSMLGGGGGGTVMQKRQSPDFRSPEVGISASASQNV